MRLDELIRKNRSAILDAWVDLTLETYPADTKRFLQKQRDPFANPVGTTISKEIDHLFTELLRGIQAENIAPCLDRIIRIRAIQDFSPSQAIAFIYLLKKIIRSRLEKDIREYNLFEELVDFETRIDELAMLSFDVYMRCREKLYEIRANQASQQVSRLLKRAGLISEIPKWGQGPREGDRST